MIVGIHHITAGYVLKMQHLHDYLLLWSTRIRRGLIITGTDLSEAMPSIPYNLFFSRSSHGLNIVKKNKISLSVVGHTKIVVYSV